MQKRENIDIWKDILEKNYCSKSFPNATSLQHDAKAYKVQLFELLIIKTVFIHIKFR